jgi:hypothetical protein
MRGLHLGLSVQIVGDFERGLHAVKNCHISGFMAMATPSGT